MEEIFSEGQRRVREKHVSLPYHRPKQRSLDEFLQRRNLVAAVPLRTSRDKLQDVWKQLEEKEKDAELFYKSEDESEDDSDDEDYCPDKKKKNGLSMKSPVKQAPETTVSPDENDLNLANTTEEKDESSGGLLADKSSPCKLNTDKSSENSENTVDSCLRLSEKLSGINSVEDSQPENSAEFSLKLPDSIEASCTDVLQRDNFPTIGKDSVSCNESIHTTTRSIQDEQNSKVVSDEGEEISKDKEEALPAVDSKVDETAFLNKESENLEKPPLVEDENQSVNNCEESTCKREISTENRCSENDKNQLPSVDGCEESTSKREISMENRSSECDKKMKDIMPESDPTFCLLLEESQDGLEVQANAVTKSTKENKTSEKIAENKEQSPEKIDWMNLKGFSDDEWDFEPAPKVTLKPDSNDMIMLDELPPRRNMGVEKLKEKFLKHASLKTVHKKKLPAQMSVVITNKNDDSKIDGYRTETFTIPVEEETTVGPKNEKPGARLSKLQIELKKKMALRRQEEWQKRLQEHKVNEEDIDEDEKSDCGALLDDDDDFNLPETESEDSDLEEDDIDLSDKKKKRSAFVDDEAEEDEDEDEDGNENESEDDAELGKIEKKSKGPTKEKSVLTEEEYEGDNDENDDEDDEEKAEDDDLVLGQTKLRSQLSPCILPNDQASKVADIGLDDSKFDFSFDTSKLGSSFDESDLNKTSNHEINGIENLINVKNSETVTESQVLELCSGKFQTQPPKIEDEDDNFVLSPTQLSSVEKSQSQFLVSKKVDPLLSSDEEAEIESTGLKKKKKVVISDDEDETVNSKEETVEKESNEDIENEDLEFDANTDEDEFLEKNEDDDDNQSVMYDSEENEIVVTKKDVGQFFDKEAELSESDWDSEDEDEKGLDRMDEELGDQEQIDEKELQQQLGKIHMRQLMDEDQRDIKLLQERFLEDGELHSDGGREKNFKWRNVDEEALDAIWRQRRNSEGEEPEEEEEGNNESDELWRRMREEKESFLKKNKKTLPKTDEDLDETVACRFLQMSKKAKLLTDKPIPKKVIDLDEPVIGIKASPATILHTTAPHLLSKGSFLSRSCQILSRVGPAVVTVNEAQKLNSKPKNTRNFVFATKSPTKDISEDSQDFNSLNKRKSDLDPDPISPVTIKKPRFMDEQKPIISNRKSFLANLVFD